MTVAGRIRNLIQQFISRRRVSHAQPELQRRSDERLRQALAENRVAAVSVEVAAFNRKLATVELRETISQTLDLVAPNRSLRDARH